MGTPIPLTKAQLTLLSEFYSLPFQKVFLNKTARTALWNAFRRDRLMPSDIHLEQNSPALFAEITKAFTSENNIQSAVFSECVYAQALANQLGLSVFADLALYPEKLSDELDLLLRSYGLVARYVYADPENTRVLVQAGGHGGVDAALITLSDKNVFTIEFKEPAAKTSEPDLPKYTEDGNLIITDEWARENPQFVTMMYEQVRGGLNFWEKAGSNEHGFSLESVQQAVTDNYSGTKFADVICVEDTKGILTMIPSNQVGMWSETRGEIRPAGRNAYVVWTPEKLKQIIYAKEGTIVADVVTLDRTKVVDASPRGGTGISRYKISPLFFVRAEDAQIVADKLVFNLSSVRQLKPTISAHMFFNSLDVNKVKGYYQQLIASGN